MANRTRKPMESVAPHTNEPAENTPAEEAEPTTDVQQEKAERTNKRCHDHPVNFPDEDALRPISEFYGKKHQMVYCRRCQSIRSKHRREALKGASQATATSPFRVSALHRDIQTLVAADMTVADAVAATMRAVEDSLPALRQALLTRFGVSAGNSSAPSTADEDSIL